MTPRCFIVEAVDTLFFRDGRPFNQDDEGMADVHSVFPPYPSVLVGAFRASVARRLGWDGQTPWGRQDTIGQVVGDGPEDMGKLRFGPQALLRRTSDGWQRLYPAPLHLLRGKDGSGCPTLVFVRPSNGTLATDLGPARLPELTAAVEGAGPLTREWLTPEGMENVLDGRRPGDDDIVAQDRLWASEYRVGLQRSHTDRTAVRGMLYAASHARTRRNVALGLEVEGLEQAQGPEPVLQLGGFQRLAGITAAHPGWRSATTRTPAGGDGRYLVVLISPLPVEGLPGWNEPGATLDKLAGKLVCACVDRPLMIGGWDGRPPRTGPGRFEGPQPTRPCLPPGSVFFIEAEAAQLAGRSWPTALGREDDIKLGFGACLIGRWPEETGA